MVTVKVPLEPESIEVGAIVALIWVVLSVKVVTALLPSSVVATV